MIRIALRLAIAFAVPALAVMRIEAQQKPNAKHEPDVLIFRDGEKLLGHLEGSTGSSVTFESDMAGEITVDWNKIQELRTSDQFAVLEKGTRLKWRKETGRVPQGPIVMHDQTIQVAPAPPAAPITVPVSNAAIVIGQPDFQKAVSERPNFFEDWKGSATAGASLVVATQDSETYASAITLTRTLPTETWMDPSNRTILSFTSSYGKLTQPGSPSVRTSIFHAEGERDEYFSPSVYAFANAGFDHDYSQGLDLQQTYGGGIGWSALKGTDQLDLKAEVDYVNQAFANPTNDQKLLGSIFSERYARKFKHNILLNQQIEIAPAWTNMRAYSANGSVSLTIPVFKRIGFTVSTLDTFLNDPSPGFRKNSFQFTTGATYTLP